MKTTDELHPSPITGITPELVPLNEIYESPRNPRRVMSDAGIEKLAASMRAEGFRPHSYLIGRPREEGGIELAAGHRRRVAALRAGLTHVPVLVKVMTDREFDEVLAFDNSGREDVHPLHEGLGWRAWIAAEYGTVEDIAARVGVSKWAIYKRLACCDLIEEGQRLWLDGIIAEAHAVQIARRPRRDQYKAVEFCTPPAYDLDQRVSVKKLAEYITRNCDHDLTRAPFSMADATLPRLCEGSLNVENLGSCLDCPRRTGTNPELFQGEDPDICTDSACYQIKVVAHTERNAPPPEVAHAKPAAPPAPKPAKAAPPVPSADIAEEAREREEEERAYREHRAKEEARIARENECAEKTYARAVDEVLAKIEWPMQAGDFAVILQYIIGAVDSAHEVADKFGIDGDNPARHVDLIKAIPKLSPVKRARVAIAAVMLDLGYQNGYGKDEEGPICLRALAKAHGVNLSKIEASVNEEIDVRLGLRKLNPPAETDARKAVLAKLPALSDAPVSWKCGMCGHMSPARFTKKCQRCGAEKGMGTLSEDELAAAPVKNKKSNDSGRRAESTDDRVSSTAKTRPGKPAKKPAPANKASAKKSAPAKGKGGKK